MEKHYALVKNNLVEAVIVGTDDFIEHIKNKYDFIIDVSKDPRPTTGDSYYPDTGTFVANHLVEHQIPVDMSADHLHNGTNSGFESFKISKYLVSYKDGVITIGCKKYSAPGILDTLHRLLIEKQRTTTYFTTLESGFTHGKFDITFEDAQKIYDALKKVKF
jgi:hypothetical protein